MNLSPENYSEICKQSAFISALVAGFSFAFLGALLISSVKNRITDWVISCSILSIAGLLVCALIWTLSASRMILYHGSNIELIPQIYLSLHRMLSFIFILSFLLFLVTLGLCGWIRSRTLGIISGLISLISIVFFIVIMSYFII
jgi:hypothetical protein